MSQKLTKEFEKMLRENDYTDYRMYENGIDAVIHRFMFTVAILSEIGWHVHGNRWCYESYEAAKEALDAWNGEGEPDGWHRHPTTGRRRHNGVETINF